MRWLTGSQWSCARTGEIWSRGLVSETRRAATCSISSRTDYLPFFSDTQQNSVFCSLNEHYIVQSCVSETGFCCCCCCCKDSVMKMSLQCCVRTVVCIWDWLLLLLLLQRQCYEDVVTVLCSCCKNHQRAELWRYGVRVMPYGPVETFKAHTRCIS